MNQLGIRHIWLALSVVVVLARHWILLLQPPGDQPFSYVAGLLIGVALTASFAVYYNRLQSETPEQD